MRKGILLSVVVGALVGGLSLAGCATTSEPAPPPPTQTAWIVVVTATSGASSAVEVPPTQTPWIVVATATRAKAAATPTRTETATTAPRAATATATLPAASPTAQRPSLTPSATAEPAALKYPQPLLREPTHGQRVPWKSEVVLEWDPVGELAADEYYRIDLERPASTAGMTPYGDYAYSKEPTWVCRGAFLDPFHAPEVQGEAAVYWWVRVVRKTGEDANGKPLGVDLSPLSEKRILIVEVKPADA